MASHRFSEIITYQQCPLRASKVYREGRTEPGTDAREIGSMVAQIMEQVRKQYLHDATFIEGEARRTIAELYCNNHALNYSLADKALEIVNKALEMDIWQFRQGQRVLIEERFYFNVDWNLTAAIDETVFAGTPDLAWIDSDEVIHIEDDKSGWSKYEPYQLYLYAFFVAKTQDITSGTAKLRFNFLNKGKTQEHEARIEDLMEMVPAWVKSEVDKIEGMTEFSATPSDKCAWCGFIGECPSYQQVKANIESAAMLEKVQGGAVDLPKLAIFYERAEFFMAECRKRLREEIKVNGDIILPDGRRLTLAAQEGFEIGMTDALIELMAVGFTEPEVCGELTLGKSDLSEIINRKYPTGGKGITKEVREAQTANRREAWEAVKATGKTYLKASVLKVVEP